MKILDTRDLNKRLEELQEKEDNLISLREERDNSISNDDSLDVINELNNQIENAEIDFDSEEQEELKQLKELESEVPEWRDGNALIPQGDWEDYCRDLVNDIGDLPKNLPSYIENNINWAGVAEDLAQDYSQIDYLNDTYYYRNC